ncbi:methionyl-tRNA formyltransferase [Ketobacter sp.]|uniref:methionyl-tRNA formyltransferase n=1 Tax=Ketobacter sp. TaxID=2083498 RepID=UPI000F1F4BCA|nr:methionyl-tRNA formyltransferase [Ketobacter sp.]RLT99249.1 MAG: methionyl-tRNA formyltransferase [Ketobacter sp.]
MSEPLNIVFAGTPDFAATVLQSILGSRHRVIACYTQPDRPAGRGRKLTPSPVKALAQEQDIAVYQPLNFKAEPDRAQLAALNADLMVVVAYGLILPRAVLEAPRLGCINVHASLLPRWRGAAPIQRAIAAGDTESGVTIMQMDVGLDTGAMLLKACTPIAADDTGGSLHDRLADMGGKAILDTLEQIADGSATLEPQDNSLATYAHKLSKEEGRLDWSRSAFELNNLVRAFNPWPVAHTELNGNTLRVWRSQALEQPAPPAVEDTIPGTLLAVNKDSLDVATGSGVLRLLELQLPGAKRLPVADILNARADWFALGARFL